MECHSRNSFAGESVAQREQEGIIPERWFKGEGLECQTKGFGNVIAPELRKRGNYGSDKESQTLVTPGILSKAETEGRGFSLDSYPKRRPDIKLNMRV